MKTRIVSILTVLGVAGAVCFGMSKQGGQPPNYGKGCIGFPGTPVPQPQLNKIIQRLQKDTKFRQNYRVSVWKNGTKTLEIGKMTINKANVSKRDASAKGSGLTALTYHVGQCALPLEITCNPNFVPSCGEHLDSRNLVQEITKILKSY